MCGLGQGFCRAFPPLIDGVASFHPPPPLYLLIEDTPTRERDEGRVPPAVMMIARVKASSRPGPAPSSAGPHSVHASASSSASSRCLVAAAACSASQPLRSASARASGAARGPACGRPQQRGCGPPRAAVQEAEAAHSQARVWKARAEDARLKGRGPGRWGGGAAMGLSRSWDRSAFS